MPNDMTIRPRAVRLLEYLEAVRGLREQPVRDVAGYQDRRWWAGDVPAHPACVLTETGPSLADGVQGAGTLGAARA